MGLRQTVVTVRWQPSDPLAVRTRMLLDLTVAAAREAGVHVVFATYPYPPREVESRLARPEAFGAWLAELAGGIRTCASSSSATSRTNRPSGGPSSPARGSCRRGRSARSSRWATTRSRTSTPRSRSSAWASLPAGTPADGPEQRLDLTGALPSSARCLVSRERAGAPFDGRAQLPSVPNVATDPLNRGYPWPNAGFVNLDRVKQALWDAFDGTAQPTTLGGLRVYLDEVGWQVDTLDRDG